MSNISGEPLKLIIRLELLRLIFVIKFGFRRDYIISKLLVVFGLTTRICLVPI